MFSLYDVGNYWFDNDSILSHGKPTAISDQLFVKYFYPLLCDSASKNQQFCFLSLDSR